MAMHELNSKEINEVSGGLSLGIDSPFLTGSIGINPAGIFTVLSGLLGGVMGLLGGLPLIGGLLGSL
ncbi:MAG: hypothetical protein PHX38_09985 [Sulfuricella sp.]|nr:hypothetical protein [Sulfuricella sp.]